MEVRGQESGLDTRYFTQLKDGTDLTDPVVNSQYFLIGSFDWRHYDFLKAGGKGADFTVLDPTFRASNVYASS